MLSQERKNRPLQNQARDQQRGPRLHGVRDTARPASPPSDEEVLALILDELSSPANRWTRLALHP